ncbi:C13 family peptidase [soil metagenome]
MQSTVWTWLVGVLCALILLGSGSPAVAQSASSSRFSGWAAGVIAADWRDPRGHPIDAFDNARRDLTAGFIAAGFSRENLVDFSLRPDIASPVTPAQALTAFGETAARATDGCLLYVTSHGSPDHMTFGPGEMAPETLANLLRRTCGARPTVLIVSACFSGIFVDGLAAPNRMIVTAARRDRTSFGCSAEFTYTFFDGCMVEALKTAMDFIALANQAKACVALKEAAEPDFVPSEPQVSIGSTLSFLLPTLRFSPRAPPSGGSSGS